MRPVIMAALAGMLVLLLGLICCPPPAGIYTHTGTSDACITGEAFVVNLDESMPPPDDAIEALRACYKHNAADLAR